MENEVQSPAVKEQPKSSCPVSRWTRPGFFKKLAGHVKPDNFFFDKLPESLSPISLNIDNIHLRWVDGYWENLGTDYEAACTQLDEEGVRQMTQENREMYAQVEILLDMNTNYELKKASLKAKLRNLEEQIRSFPGLNDYSDSF